MAGRLVWKQSVSGSMSSGGIRIPLSLSSGPGTTLGSGVYLYRGTATVGGSTVTTGTEKIIILRQ